MSVNTYYRDELSYLKEMGHLFAAREGIRPGNAWINELVANIFAQAYIRSASGPLGMQVATVPSCEHETSSGTILTG